MPAVATFCRNREQPVLRALCLVLGLGLSLGLTQGCARSEALKRGEVGSATKEENLPFHADSLPASSSGGERTAASSDPKQSASVPFRALSEPRILAAGTLLTVQLQEPLSTARARPGDTFTAVVTTPLTGGQDILVKSGAVVIGRIESEALQAGHAGRTPGAGYFRLTLSSIAVGGREVTVQTSSLFARGAVQPAGVGVQKGHRLTFRLTVPVALDVGPTTAITQSPSPSIP
jgi:hypothetical protein